MKIHMITIKTLKHQVSGQIDPINLEQFFARNLVLLLPKPDSLKIDEFVEKQILVLRQIRCLTKIDIQVWERFALVAVLPFLLKPH